jgi:hypothetical protein
MIQHITAAHKLDLEENYNTDTRFYFNPRGTEYPPISGTPAYSAITSADQMPGTFNLDTCDLSHLIQWTNPITYEILVKPQYAYTIGASQYFMEWVAGAEVFTLAYTNSTDRFSFIENIGGASVIPFSPVFTSDAQLQVWHRLTIVVNGTVLWAYANGAKTIGAIATAGALNQHILMIPGNVDHLINYVRIFPNYAATDADVADSFKHVTNEEIYFDFNKTAVGRARCNLHDPNGKCYVTGYSMDRSLGYKAAGASLSLNNLAGEFSDDQFAAFDPTAGSYNGTATQKYLARKIPIEIETWYGSTFEPLFIGSCPPGSFARSTQAGGISTLSISADDGIADIARRIVRKARKWAGYYLSRATPASNSVFHEIAELATKREVYNYFGNSSFENATIGNSWSTDGTFARDTTAVLAGTYCGKFTGNGKTIWQAVTFADLSKGERFTASFFVYSTSAITGHLTVYDRLAAATLGSTDVAWTHSGLGWDLIQCTHTVVDSTSDRIVVGLLFHGNLANVPVDCASLVYGDYKPYFVENTNDGAAGVTPSSSAMLGSYDWIGINAEDISDIHPWARIGIGEKVWDHIKMIGDAGIARYIGIDHSNVLVFKSMLASAVPASLGSLPMPNAIGSGQQDLVANKVKVQGAYFELRDRVETVWQAEASGLKSDASNTGSKFRRTLANGETIPDPDPTLEGASVYEARYGDITDKNIGYDRRGH